jgi:hypothetical protein
LDMTVCRTPVSRLLHCLTSMLWPASESVLKAFEGKRHREQVCSAVACIKPATGSIVCSCRTPRHASSLRQVLLFISSLTPIHVNLFKKNQKLNKHGTEFA